MSFKELVDLALEQMISGAVTEASRTVCTALLHADATKKSNEHHLRRLEVAAALADNLRP